MEPDVRVGRREFERLFQDFEGLLVPAPLEQNPAIGVGHLGPLGRQFVGLARHVERTFVAHLAIQPCKVVANHRAVRRLDQNALVLRHGRKVLTRLLQSSSVGRTRLQIIRVSLDPGGEPMLVAAGLALRGIELQHQHTGGCLCESLAVGGDGGFRPGFLAGEIA